MFNIKYLFALTGLILSFASFNTASYANMNCDPDQTDYASIFINNVGFSTYKNHDFFTTQTGVNFYTKTQRFQPILLTAFLSHIPVHFCVKNVQNPDGLLYVEKIELLYT